MNNNFTHKKAMNVVVTTRYRRTLVTFAVFDPGVSRQKCQRRKLNEICIEIQFKIKRSLVKFAVFDEKDVGSCQKRTKICTGIQVISQLKVI